MDSKRPDYEVEMYKDLVGYKIECFECGKEYDAVRSDSAFCSSKCRVRNHRKKDKLDKDIQQTKDLIASLINRMPPRGASKTFIALNEIRASIDNATRGIEDGWQ